MNPEFWNQRYTEPGYAYGNEPNDFLVSVTDRIPGPDILCICEGEGRNAVYLARQGFQVTAVDYSAAGMDKARHLAGSHGVQLTTVIQDLSRFDFGVDRWDAVVSVFCHLAPSLRAGVHTKIKSALRPGGIFILETYTPEQLKFQTGGPKHIDLLFSPDDARRELSGLKIILFREAIRDVREGAYHTGNGAVLQIVAERVI